VVRGLRGAEAREADAVPGAREGLWQRVEAQGRGRRGAHLGERSSAAVVRLVLAAAHLARARAGELHWIEELVHGCEIRSGIRISPKLSVALGSELV